MIFDDVVTVNNSTRSKNKRKICNVQRKLIIMLSTMLNVYFVIGQSVEWSSCFTFQLLRKQCHSIFSKSIFLSIKHQQQTTNNEWILFKFQYKRLIFFINTHQTLNCFRICLVLWKFMLQAWFFYEKLFLLHPFNFSWKYSNT